MHVKRSHYEKSQYWKASTSACTIQLVLAKLEFSNELYRSPTNSPNIHALLLSVNLTTTLPCVTDQTNGRYDGNHLLELKTAITGFMSKIATRCLGTYYSRRLQTPTCTRSCITRSSSVVRVLIKSGPSAVNVAVTEALMLFSITDMISAGNEDDNPSLPRRASFDMLSKFVLSEFSSQADTTGAVASASAVTAVSDRVITAAALLTESLLG